MSKSNGYSSEDAFQAAATMWLWNKYPILRRTWTHPANEREIPNKTKDPVGYKKAIIKLKQDQAKGMLIGAADFWLMVPLMCIELKQPGEKQTAAQIECEEACKRCNIPYHLVEYMEDFQRIVTDAVEKIKWW